MPPKANPMRPYYGGGRPPGKLNGAGKRNRIQAIEDRAAARAKVIAIEQQCHTLVIGLLAGAVATADLIDPAGEVVLVYKGEELSLHLLQSIPEPLLCLIDVPPSVANAVVQAYAEAHKAVEALQLKIKPLSKYRAVRPFGR
jgi:hypothetical protein